MNPERASHNRDRSRSAAGADLTPIDKSKWEALFDSLRIQATILNEDPAVVENGYQYPMQWLDDAEAAAYAQIDEWNKWVAEPTVDIPDKPSIHVFGYGSLNSLTSASRDLGDLERVPVILDCSKVHEGGTDTPCRFELVRELNYPGVRPLLWHITNLGVDIDTSHGVATVSAKEVNTGTPYTRDEQVNGALYRIDSLDKLTEKEFSYFLLPGPPAVGFNDDTQRFEVVLLCWPRGRSLIEKELSLPDGTSDDFAKETWQRELDVLELHKDDNLFNITHDELVTFYELWREQRDTALSYAERIIREKEEDPEQEKLDEQLRILTRLAEKLDTAYSLDRTLLERPDPDYVIGACLGRGNLDPAFLRHYLETTFYYNSNGERENLLSFIPELRYAISYSLMFSERQRWRLEREGRMEEYRETEEETAQTSRRLRDLHRSLRGIERGIEEGTGDKAPG